MKLFLMLTVLVTSLNVFANISVEDCGTYGPTEKSIAVLLDDEEFGNVLRIGYVTTGEFFEFRLEGCEVMSFYEREFFCNDKVVGTMQKKLSVSTDFGYSSPAAYVTLSDDAFELTGSCQQQDEKPFTIKF